MKNLAGLSGHRLPSKDENFGDHLDRESALRAEHKAAPYLSDKDSSNLAIFLKDQVVEQAHSIAHDTNLDMEEKCTHFLNLIEQLSLLIEDDTVAHMAYHDHLTGLPNRYYWAAMFAHFTKTRSFKKQEKMCAVLFLDLDNFKKINNQYGHMVGDSILKTFTHRLKANIRPGDFCARFGGDEFIMWVENVSADDLTHLIQRLQGLLAQPYRIVSYDRDYIPQHGQETITLSIGATFVTGSLQEIDPVHHATLALRQAKKRGKNTTVVYDT